MQRRFKNQIKKIRQNITDKTHPIDYYNPLFYDVSDDFGTLHVSTIGKVYSIMSIIIVYGSFMTRE